ncbi:putative zinc-binding metallopeptidase [Parapedobacter deserti]|uniref:Zinc-binding metallopeptidase n=1 Tax=Parapedobacter deserti TaxID=1912957 RepID=A0ABV7JF37_9SPHI
MKRVIACMHVVIVAWLGGACDKAETLPDTPIVGLGGETWVKGPIDSWLDAEFLTPYNIEVKYKWDPFELNYQRNLVPIAEEKVEPVMAAVKDIWIKPYEKVAESTFIKTYVPKQFVLAGSAEYNTDGTVVLGQAEGGRKVLLLRLNRFERSNMGEVRQLLHTIHHEFAHILHQSKLYPVAWKALNPQWYTATWYNNTDAAAHRQGLISAYAKANPDEDFVETISFLLVYGQAYYDSVIAKDDVPEAAKVILRRKQNMVVEYFLRNFEIDFSELQRETQAAIARYMHP